VYVAGPSLFEAVRGHGPLPVRTVLALAAGLAESLGAIHAAGVIHGDLKPSNVLLAEDGPRVIDFGISQAAEASAATGNEPLIGSPRFMSPEQVLGSGLSAASDMFSLGGVLTFAATGQGPFGSGSNAALMYRLVNSPASLGSVPGELRGLIGKCLAKHPGDRPTARELLTQVGEIQPAPGWLAESIIAGFTQDRSAADASGGAGGAGNLLALTEAASGPPPPGGAVRPGRHRISRPLASAGLRAGLVAACAVGVFALIGADRTPHPAGVQPQAGAGSVAVAPALASTAPASPGPSSSVTPEVSVSPSAYLTPGLSKFVSPSLTPATVTSPTAKPTKSSSPKPSKSASSSASASPSSSPSSSASSSGSASPSSSPSSSSSSSASPSPSSSSPSGSTSPSAPPSSPAATTSTSAPATSM
jgi:serine/threonine protein kinase